MEIYCSIQLDAVYAVPDVKYQGRVQSLSDATGSAFSLVPMV